MTPQNDRRAFALRSIAFGLIIAALFLVLLTRLWYLQIVHGDEYRAAAEDNQARTIRTRAPRGSIVDRNGIVLASNRSQFAVYATPDVLNNDAVLKRLAKVLGADPDDIKDDLKDGQQNPYDPLRVAINVPIDLVTRVEESRPFMPGVTTQPEPVRWYPNADLASQTLGVMGRIDPNEYTQFKDQGYFRDDYIGKSGLEMEDERYLHGTPGAEQVQINARGKRIRVVGTQPPTPGNTVVLTLDSKVQAAAENAFHEHGFTGAAVAIDPRTGAVLALASAPTYNPNMFATGVSAKDWAPISTNPKHPLINRTVDAMYPPGSTFKPMVAAAGLQCGAISTHTSTYCPGYLMLGRAKFGCWMTHGEVDFYSAIAMSCDVFFYEAGQKIGPDRMSQYAKAFGLAAKTGIDLPSEDIGSIPSPSWKAKHFARAGAEFAKWYGGDTLHMSIGQGDVLVTPLQMALSTAAIANGGDLMRPYLTDRIKNPVTGAVIHQTTPVITRRVPISDENLADVRRAMRQTVTNGTGKVILFPEVATAAKTGSAQVHGSDKTHGWFICFAPIDHPTIAIAAIVEHGGHGADSAGLIARAMLQQYFHLKQASGQMSKSD